MSSRNAPLSDTYGTSLLNDDLISADGLPSLQADKRPQKRSSCFLDAAAASLTLANSALGAGILAYPYAFMSAGVAGASIATAFMALCSFVSLCCIMRLMATAQFLSEAPVRSFGDLVRLAFGDCVCSVVEALVVFYCFGACVGYIVLLGDVFTPLMCKAVSGRLSFSKVHLIMEAGCAVLAWLLCLLRRISALKYTAVLAVAATFCVVAMLVRQVLMMPCDAAHCTDETGKGGWPLPAGDGWLWPADFAGLLRALPLIAFAMQCHMQMCIVYAEMPSHIAESQGRRRAVALASVMILLVMYFPTGIAGFMRFGEATNGDILQNFVVSDGLADMARVCIGLTALASFPLQHFPARAALDALWRRRCAKGAERMSTTFLLVESSVWVAAALGLAIVAGSNLAVVFQLVGAIAGAPPVCFFSRRSNGSSLVPSRASPTPTGALPDRRLCGHPNHPRCAVGQAQPGPWRLVRAVAAAAGDAAGADGAVHPRDGDDGHGRVDHPPAKRD